MESLADKYWKKFLAAIRTGSAVDFPMDSTLVQNDWNFLLYVDKVNKLCIEYEEIKTLYAGDPPGMVRFLLGHLRKYWNNRERESYKIMKAFFMELDYPDLPDNLKTRFDEGIGIFEQRIDYFCSYTSKGLPEINHTYGQLLSTVFGINMQADFFELKHTNYLAKLIVRYLNEHGFNNYFFDQDKIVNGDEIKEKVLDYCSRAIVLVILAQQETFRDRGDEENWCFKEYEHYNNTHSGQRQYLVYKIPSITKPLGAREAIRHWFDYISTSEGIRSETIEFDWTNYRLKALIDKDAEVIDRAREDYYQNFVLGIV
ncbi:MAG: hypothetical protein WCK34_09595 [Bacteroidota bacterium]